jgi:HlyD family secretion protein
MKRPVIRWIGLIVVLAGIVGVGWFFVAPRVISLINAQTSLPPYHTAKVQKDDLFTTVDANGTVRSKQSAVLVWQTTGVVGQANVTRGQIVSTDDVLAQLKDTSLPQSIILARANIVAAQKTLDNLLNTSVARANAELALMKTQKTLDDAIKAQRSKQFQVASPETIDIAHANLISANDALDKAEKIFNSNSQRDESDVVFAAALAMYARARQIQTVAQYNYEYVKGLPNSLDVQTANATVDVAQANLTAAKQEWERVKDGPNQQDIAAAQAQVAAAQAILDMAFIKAPFTGTVTVANSKVGDQVAPATVAFQIDDLSHLYVDMDVSELDFPLVRIGLPVTLTLDAFPDNTYQGKISDMAIVGKNISGTVYYTVTVEITSQEATDRSEIRIHPGMTAAATITLNEMKGAILLPKKAVTKLGNTQVVYLLKDDQPVPVTVALGISSGDLVQVTAGALEEGDLVIISPVAAADRNGLSALAPVPLPASTLVGAVSATATPEVTATTAATDTPAVDPAAQTVKDYFTALQNKDYKAAADLTSTFSLTVDGMTRGDGAVELHNKMQAGMEWSDLQVHEKQAFLEKTHLVHVTYTLTTQDAKTGETSQASMDELWPVTFENNRWLYNRNNLIDFHSLTIDEQAMAGLRMRPVRLARYSDHITLTLLVQNTTNDAIVLGQTNEILAAFTFKEQTVEAVKKQMIFQRLRSDSNATIEVKGLFTSYPEQVIIRQWKNLKVAPWYDFKFSN